MANQIDIKRVDYRDAQQGQELLALLDAYARDPMGGGQPLGKNVWTELLPLLQRSSQAISFIGYENGEPVGLINGFETVSTFAARPLINIHDLAVLSCARGKGIGRQLIQAMETHAIARGCCKLTLEVLTGNRDAAELYQRVGFQAYQLDPSQGQAVFLQKKLL